jgi:hypothetical protein
MSTASIDPQSKQKQDAVCLTLTSQIEALNNEGIPDKMSKAAAKKYKLKGTDLTKADELNKANSEFQTKCSNYPPKPTVAAATPVTTEPAGGTTTTKTAVKVKPPVPSPKPVAAAMAPQTSSSAPTPVADGSATPAP